jgi:hypothetical protein
MVVRHILLAAAVAGGLAAFPAAAAADPGVSARALRCRTAAGSGMPSADFEGAMRAVPGTRRMSMRFELQERLAEGSWSTVRAPSLERWRRSLPGVRAFSFVQRVDNLRLEGAYRVVVRFRWLGSGGQVIRATRRASNACRAVEPFPVG